MPPSPAAGRLSRSTTGSSELDPVGHGTRDAPTVVGGVAAPSEIATGVPNDLDLICRMTLSEGQRGPLSPGDLALQIAPWPSGPPLSDGASGIRLPAPREQASPTRVLPAAAAAGAAAGAATGKTASSLFAGSRRLEGADEAPPTTSRAIRRLPTLWHTPAPRPDEHSGDHTDVIPAAEAAAAGAGGASSAGSAESGGAGLAGAGAAAAGAAAAIGNKVGSFARAAADRAAARSAERRMSHDDYDGDEIALDEALEEADGTEIEPPLPVFGRDAPERPSRGQSLIALGIVGVLVVVALVIGISNVAKIGKSDGESVAGPVVTVTGHALAGLVCSATEPSATTTEPSPAPTPVSITGGKGYDEQDGDEADQTSRTPTTATPAPAGARGGTAPRPTTATRTDSASSSISVLPRPSRRSSSRCPPSRTSPSTSPTARPARGRRRWGPARGPRAP